MEDKTRKEGLNWLASLFGGGAGDVVAAKKARKKQLEDAVKNVGTQRKKKNGY